jgi:hypothetical protein
MDDGTKITIDYDGMARVLFMDFSDGTRLEVRAWDDDKRPFSEILKLAAKRIKQEDDDRP